MTRQEYYDLVVESAINGTFPSTRADGSCVYRGPNGKKCIAGLLIPDEKYSPGMEGRPAYNIEDIIELPDGISITDVTRLQRIHDTFALNRWDAPTFVGILNLDTAFLTCFPRSPTWVKDEVQARAPKKAE